jgi:tight adherence protein B
MGLFIAIAVFLLIAAGGFALVLFKNWDSTHRVVRRMGAIEAAREREEAPADQQLLRDEQLSTLPLLNRILMSWSPSQRLRVLLTQAGLQMKPGKLVLVMGILFLGTNLVFHNFSGSLLSSIVVGAAVGSLPLFVVFHLRSRRRHEFEKHFADSIDLLCRAVRAGHALNTGMEMVGQEMPEPVASEFRSAFEERRLGLSLRESLLHMSDRMPSQDVRFFVTAVIIQDETGGNLAEILNNLATTIRERFRIRGEVRVKTAQGRLTAGLLIAIPPLMLVLMSVLNPDYVHVLFSDLLGTELLVGAGLLQVLGAYILWRIVSIEV